MYVDMLLPLAKAIPIMLERITAYYQTLKTWIDHNVKCYHNFNLLPHTLPLISPQCNEFWGYL